MNEATLEARLNEVLEKIFPTFRDVKVKHQESFSINFGHRNVKVDLKDPSTYPNRAIYDILLSIDDLNIMLVELKRKGLQLTEEDEKQGLSYARLIPEMPPIVLISNGDENRLFDTYTQKPIESKSIDFDFIKEKITASFQLAASEFKNAVEFLFSRQPEIVGKIIRQISCENFQRLTGEIYEVDKAISNDFQINRLVTHRLFKNVLRNVNLIGLVGSAFSGKTNILFQFYKYFGYNKDTYVLYIDLKDLNYSIFRRLANEFSKETKASVSDDKIREWFLSLLHVAGIKLVLLIDNFTKDVPEQIANELIELIDIFKGSNQSIIYSIDEWNYKELAFIENRNYKNIIGQLTKLFFVRPINDKEFKRVNRSLSKSSGVMIQHGGFFTSEFREPRVLRHIASISKKKKVPETHFMMVLPIPTIYLNDSISKNQIFNKKIHEDYKKLASAFILDQSFREASPHLNIIATTTGAVSKLAFTKLFKDTGLLNILKSGLVIEREYTKGLTVILPKIIELFIHHAIIVIYNIINGDKDSNDAKYDKYLKYCRSFPSGDIIGHGVLRLIGNDNVDLFSYFIHKLLAEKPVTESIKAGTKALVFMPEFGYVHLNFETDMDEESTFGYHLPYAILSQLAHDRMESEDEPNKRGYLVLLAIIYKVGSFNGVFIRAEGSTFSKAKGFPTYEIEGVGTVSSVRNGITEAIVQAISKHFFDIPATIEQLYEIAKSQLNYPLLWRIDLALIEHVSSHLVELREKAIVIRKEIRKLFFELFNKQTGIDIPVE